MYLHICTENLIIFQPELDGDKLGRNLSFPWQGFLVGQAGSVLRSQKPVQSLVLCVKTSKAPKDKQKQKTNR